LLAGLIASTVAFFAASYFIKRWMDENDIPKGMTRNLAIFTLAIAVAYGVGWLVERVAGA
jgi:VIT1/CCC1 family predicted Fe2+/Mn2+ transporter